MSLDAVADLAAVDRSNALGEVLASAQQWQSARALALPRVDLDGIDAVVVSGMGGSGISGDIVAAIADGVLAVPVVVWKSYGLPAWVGPRTLVVAVSYSGTTEETLSAYAAAGQRGARRLAVCSGGELGQAAAADGTPCAIVPGGGQPRHSLGFLLVPVLAALSLDAGLEEAIDVLAAVTARLGPDVSSDENPGKQIARRLAGSDNVSLILAAEGVAATAADRLRCQLAENAKLPAMTARLPEANHNDIVGWQEPSALWHRTGVVTIRDRDGEDPRLARRFEITERMLADRVAWQATIATEGSSSLARCASALLTCDLVSVYTALALGRDPTPIPFIERIKASVRAEAGGE